MAKQNNLSKILGCLLVAAGLFSCEKVIDAGIRDAEKKFVVEGVLTDGDSCKVFLSQTKNFSDSNGFHGINGAIISVSDNGGPEVYLQQTGQGIYQHNNINGVPGHTYTLKVLIDGKTFTATSTMPQKVNFDSLYISKRTGFDGQVRKVATVRYDDPVGKGQAYRFMKYVNREYDYRLFVNDDNLSDGRTVRAELRGGLETGDTVRVVMQCIDYPMYKYWYSLGEGATGDGNDAAPANPVTNMQGGALGYFTAHTVQEKSLIVQQ